MTNIIDSMLNECFEKLKDHPINFVEEEEIVPKEFVDQFILSEDKGE